MKIKDTKNYFQKLEKKNSSFFILDLYIQRGESFYISVIEHKFVYHKLYDYNDNIILPGYYPRIKKYSFYDKENLQKSSSYTLTIKPLVKQKTNEENSIENNIKLKEKSNRLNSKLKGNLKISKNRKKTTLVLKENSENIRGKANVLSPSNIKNKFELKETCNINSELKDLVYKEEKLNLNQIKIIEIEKDGNCFYRCLSFFLLKSQEYYQNIKDLIIEWIEAHYDNYLEFFGDDDANNITREEIAQNEFDYIKSKDSWGSHYTISIACLILNIDIAVYTYEGNNIYKPYNLFKIDNEEKELCILNYHNNYHFELIYSIH